MGDLSTDRAPAAGEVRLPDRLTSSIARMDAIARNESLLLWGDKAGLAVLLVVPVVTMLYTQRIFRDVLIQEGTRNANGATQSVPGTAVLFGTFIASYAALSFFREHRFGTWTRLHSTQARGFEVVVGKLVPWLILATFQQSLFFAIGVAALHLPFRGVSNFLLIALPFIATLMCIGVMLVSVCRSAIQLAAYAELSGLILAGLGGAVVPISTMPYPFRVLGPFVPTYWAMRGYRDLTMRSPGAWEWILPALVLLATATVAVLISARRIRQHGLRIVE